MTLFTFTPKKFITLLLAAIIITLGTSRTPASHRSAQNSLFSLYPTTEAVGQDNGTLTSNFYLATNYTPTPVTHTPDRHTVMSEPTPQPSNPPQPVRRNYPPLAH